MSTGRKCVTGCALAAQHTLKCVRTKAVAKAVSNFDSHKKRPWIIQKALLFPSFCARFIQIVTFAQLMLKMVFAKSMNLFQKKHSLWMQLSMSYWGCSRIYYLRILIYQGQTKFQNFWKLLEWKIFIHVDLCFFIMLLSTITKVIHKVHMTTSLESTASLRTPIQPLKVATWNKAR